MITVGHHPWHLDEPATYYQVLPTMMDGKRIGWQHHLRLGALGLCFSWNTKKGKERRH